MDGVLSAKSAFKSRKTRSERGRSKYPEWEKALLNIEGAKYIFGHGSLSRLDDLGLATQQKAVLI
jgi:hypothetical protein